MNNYEYHKKVNTMIDKKYNERILKYDRVLNRLWWISISCFIVSFVLFIIAFTMKFMC